MHHSWVEWTVFFGIIVFMLVLDLGVFQKKSHKLEMKEALIWSGVWIALSVMFGIYIYLMEGSGQALNYFTGYLLEKSLSVDNIFVFILIFSYFKVNDKYQHKILFWGIIGALIMRAIFIVAGIALMQTFHFMIYIFGALLIYTAIKMIVDKDKEIHPEHNPVIKFFRKHFRVSEHREDGKFFLKDNLGKLVATPLFIVLLVIETTDVVFAVDSIPAILAITNDTFIVFTSNIFAILGLRALYFAVSGVMQLFRYLSYGLSAILGFIGLKMLASDFFEIPIQYALGVIAVILTISILASVWIKEKPKELKE
ncbi:MAG: TerC family protein [bacterium]